MMKAHGILGGLFLNDGEEGKKILLLKFSPILHIRSIDLWNSSAFDGASLRDCLRGVSTEGFGSVIVIPY